MVDPKLKLVLSFKIPVIKQLIYQKMKRHTAFFPLSPTTEWCPI